MGRPVSGDEADSVLHLAKRSGKENVPPASSRRKSDAKIPGQHKRAGSANTMRAKVSSAGQVRRTLSSMASCISGIRV